MTDKRGTRMSGASRMAVRCMRAGAIAVAVIACAPPAVAQYDQHQWRKKNPGPGPGPGPQGGPKGAFCVPSVAFSRSVRPVAP